MTALLFSFNWVTNIFIYFIRSLHSTRTPHETQSPSDIYSPSAVALDVCRVLAVSSALFALSEFYEILDACQYCTVHRTQKLLHHPHRPHFLGCLAQYTDFHVRHGAGDNDFCALACGDSPYQCETVCRIFPGGVFHAVGYFISRNCINIHKLIC